MSDFQLLRGHLVDAGAAGTGASPTDIPDGCLVIEERRIADLGPTEEIRRRHPGMRIPEKPKRHAVILPGLIDIHAHLPQYPAVARTERELLPWLERHIFPLESGFRGTGEETARAIEAFFDEMLAGGTTSIVLYGAIWQDSCNLAFEIAARRGLRLILGKVMMDDRSYGGLPADEALEVSIRETRQLAERWHGANDGLLEYAVSPRFAVSCSREMMQAAAEVAREHDCFIQTHLSENHAEIGAVGERFPWARDYTDVYDRCGLLTGRTILGHCLHLSEREVATLAERDCIIAHCPSSNLFLNSGFFARENFQRAGLRTCLGSDVAGGPELNMWQVMRSAIDMQKMRRFSNPELAPLEPLAACRMATFEAAQALGHNTGRLATGVEADLLVVDLDTLLPRSASAAHKAALSAPDILALLVYRGQPSATLATWVAGQQVFSAAGGEITAG